MHGPENTGVVRCEIGVRPQIAGDKSGVAPAADGRVQLFGWARVPGCIGWAHMNGIDVQLRDRITGGTDYRPRLPTSYTIYIWPCHRQGGDV